MTESESNCPFCSLPLEPGSAGGLCPRCSLDAVLPKEKEILESQSGGPKIEGIELQAEIGEGGFGIVYRAYQTGMVRRKVALKVLKPGVDTRQVLRRFEVERQALAHLEHPGIARFYEAGQTKEGYPYFTMELIEGVPISEAIGGQPLRDVISLFLQVCESVAHAHAQGILHRDLKPENILVTPAGAPKIIDFGLAKALDAEQAPGMTLYTGGEAWLGTPGYSAPEQLKASEIQIDERADVFSLGAILYHVLTGMNPGDAHELEARPNTLPPASEIALQKIDEALDTITLHALEPDRDDRYFSVRDLIVDLRSYLNGNPLSVSKPRRKCCKVAIFTLVAILFLGIGWLAISQIPKESDHEATTKEEESLSDIIKQDLDFEEIGFITLEPGESPIPPFTETTKFTWTRFRKPDGGEFILSHDGLHGSPTVTRFFIGGKRPDEPSVKIIPFNSAEDKALLKFYLNQGVKALGAEEAEKLCNTAWNDLHKLDYRFENPLRLSMLRNLVGSIRFVRNHRTQVEGN